MYAWLVSPETIPREYNNWILQASKVPEFAVMANRTMVRDGVIEPVQVQRALNHRVSLSAHKESGCLTAPGYHRE